MTDTAERRLKTSRVRMAAHSHRVLLYTSCYNVLDGVTLTIRKIEQEILAAGHHVCIMTTKSGNMSNTHMDGTHPNRKVIFMDNSVPIPFSGDPNNPELFYHLGFSISRNVRSQIDEFEPSIIHITAPDCTCLHLIQYARSKEIPLMGTYHSNIPEYMDHYPGLSWLKHILGAFFRHQYNFLQALYVPTPFIHRHLSDTYQMDKITNLQIWGRGIDLEKFSPSHRSLIFRQKLGIDDQDVVICWVGRIVNEKRPDIFANVIKRLYARNVPFHALVIGAGPGEDDMKALPNTTYCGWLGGDELSIAYASSDVFLFPSSVETFGNVTLEAAASGLPLVVEAGCSGHLVRDGINGFACEAGDEDSFFEATLSLVVDDAQRHAFSLASREHSLHFEKQTIVRKMLENYSRVTDQFYCEFGGHHEKRDRMYKNEYSFRGGNLPRPLGLVFVEYLFVLLFRVMWYFATVFFWFQETVMSRMIPTPRAPSPVAHLSRAQLLSKKVHEGTGKRSLSEVTLDFDDEDVEADLLMDDSSSATASTSSLSSASCCVLPSPSMCFGDCMISHVIAIWFVNVILLQFRMESAIRNTVSFCISPSKWTFHRKRKNSSVPPAQLTRQRSNGSDPSLDASVAVSSSRDEELGRRVRRSPSSSALMSETVL